MPPKRILTPAQKEAALEASRRYYARHPEKRKEQLEALKAKRKAITAANADARAAAVAARKVATKLKKQAKVRAWIAANKDRVRACARAADKLRRAADPERYREKNRNASKKYVYECTDAYLRALDPALPKELYDVKRMHLRIERKLKEQKHAQVNPTQAGVPEGVQQVATAEKDSGRTAQGRACRSA